MTNEKPDEEALPNAIEHNQKINIGFPSPSDSGGEVLTYEEDRVRRESQFIEATEKNAAAKLRNPLAGLSSAADA